MFYRKTLLSILLLLAFCALLPWKLAKATPFFQQENPLRRDPQQIRDLYLQGNPADQWRTSHTPPSLPEISKGLTNNPPNWAHLVFQSFRGFSWDLHTLEPDGTEHELESGEGSSWYPALAKNGLQIAFTSNLSGNWDIHAISYDGSNLAQITFDPGSDLYPSWSPDGSTIIFQSNRTGNYDLYRMAPDGSGVTSLTNSPAYEGEPSWSPDGKQIVYVSNQTGTYELWVMNQDGSNPHQISFGLNYALAPKWSPKGDRIAFSQDSDNNTFYEVWFIDPEGSNLSPLDNNVFGNRDLWGVSWSPDGEWVAYTNTYWIQYQGNWYWTTSYLLLTELSSGNGFAPLTDDLIWRVDWAASDPLPPTACLVTTSTQTRSKDIPVFFSAQDQGASGILAYDGEVRQLNGLWQPLVNWITSDGAVYQGSGLGQVEFRCRAYDRGGNVGPWSLTPTVSPHIDAIPPHSSISADENFVKTNNVTLSWAGSDPGSGVADFDIFVRDGKTGTWGKWLSGLQYQSALFSGEVGHTYYFRSQAHDQAGHTQPWRAEAQTSVTFYEKLLSVFVADIRGTPIPNAIATLQPSAIANEIQNTNGLYNFYLGSEISHTLTVSAPGFDPLPDTVLSITGDTTFHSILPPQNQLIPNSGFESGALEGWTVVGTGASITTADRHTGEFALQISQTLTPTTTVLSQTLILAPSIANPTLSFFYRISTIESGNLEVIVTDTVSPTLSTTVLSTTTAVDWTHLWADLSPYSGHSIILTIKFTDGIGTIQLDEISIGEWDEPIMDDNYYLYLPLTFYNASTNNYISADWPMIGYDLARAGYNRGEPGASRYELEWSFNVSENCDGAQPVFVVDGILITSTRCGYETLAIDAEQGVQLWQHSSASSPNWYSISHGNVYFDTSSYPSVFYALNLYDGTPLWSFPASQDYVPRGSLAPLIAEHWIYIEGEYGYGITAINPASGTLAWEKRYPTYIQGDTWTGAYDNGVIYTWIDGELTAINPKMGGAWWSLKIYNSSGWYRQMPVISGDIALVGREFATVSAINLETHQSQWTITIENSFGGYEPLFAVADNEVYIPKGPLEVHDLTDGALLWTFLGDDELFWNPIVTQNYVYVSSVHHTYVLNRTTHEVVWQTDQGGWLAVANGFLYIASDDGIIRAYRAQEP